MLGAYTDEGGWPMSETERRVSVEMAFANSRLEGLVETPEMVRDAEAYIAGRVTADELIERTRAKYAS